MKKYQQIIADLTHKINQGHLQSGAKLPSVREMMLTYDCSKATVLHSMTELKTQELIYAKDRSGYFVLGKKEIPPVSEEFEFDFSSRGVILGDFSFSDFQTCLLHAIKQYPAELSRYGSPKGVALLRETLVKRLEEEAIYTKQAHIFVTSGVQEALYIVSQLDFPNGDQTILVEEPSYNTYLATLSLLNKKVLGIKRQFSGLNLDELEQLFREQAIKFFYLMPRIQNPLGTTLPQSQMKKIVELAERYDVYLIEDDYLADFVHETNRLPLHYYDRYDRVIYLKSFSKVLFPGIRIGVAVLPKKLQAQFEQYKLAINLSSDSMSQIALSIYIRNGLYARNKQILAEKVWLKAITLNESLHRHLADLSYAEDVCVHSTLELPAKVNKASLLHALAAQGVSVDTLADSYLQQRPSSLIKLNVTKIAQGKIDEGIEKIASLLRTIAKRGT